MESAIPRAPYSGRRGLLSSAPDTLIISKKIPPGFTKPGGINHSYGDRNTVNAALYAGGDVVVNVTV